MIKPSSSPFASAVALAERWIGRRIKRIDVVKTLSDPSRIGLTFNLLDPVRQDLAALQASGTGRKEYRGTNGGRRNVPDARCPEVHALFDTLGGFLTTDMLEDADPTKDMVNVILVPESDSCWRCV